MDDVFTEESLALARESIPCVVEDDFDKFQFLDQLVDSLEKPKDDEVLADIYHNESVRCHIILSESDYNTLYLPQPLSWSAYWVGNKWYIGRRVKLSERNDWKVQRIYMHRAIYWPDGNTPKEIIVDHMSGNTLNNSRRNIRRVSLSENNHNNPPKGKIPFYGVSEWTNASGRVRYRASCCKKQVAVRDTPEEAALEYDKHAKRIFGKSARLNFPLTTNEQHSLREKFITEGAVSKADTKMEDIPF